MSNTSNAPEADFPSRGRLLGIDYGSRRVGLAICNPDQTMAGALEMLPRTTPSNEARRLQTLVREERIVGLIVGLPVHLSGDEGASARAAREFGNWAAECTQVPVRFWDERFTSALAEQYLLDAQLTSKQRKARIDKLAAQILLQSYLDSPTRTETIGSIRD